MSCQLSVVGSVTCFVLSRRTAWATVVKASQRTTDHGQLTKGNRQMRCIYCPTQENLHCSGLDVRRFCELIDPSCPQYDSRYLDVIVREAQSTVEHTASRVRSYHQPEFSKPILEGGETIGRSLDCCGGALPLGMFDEP